MKMFGFIIGSLRWFASLVIIFFITWPAKTLLLLLIVSFFITCPTKTEQVSPEPAALEQVSPEPAPIAETPQPKKNKGPAKAKRANAGGQYEGWIPND
jgi:hypothetical protein